MFLGNRKIIFTIEIKTTTLKSFTYILLFFCVLTSIHAQDLKEYESVSSNYYAESLFIEGKTLELQQKYSEAIENYRAALNYDKAPGIYYTIASVYVTLKRQRDALAEINNALRLAPRETIYKELKGDIYISLGEWDKAAVVYEDLISSDSNDAAALYTLARIYQEIKQPSKAVAIYELITDKIGFDYDVLKRMYDIYYSYKDYDKCVEVLKYALKLDPYDSGNLKLLGSLSERTGRYEEARKILEDLFALNPQDKELQTGLVKIYFRQNDYRKAFSSYAKTLGKDSLSYEEKVQIGELYLNLIRQDSTASEIARVIFNGLNTEYPERWMPYYFLASIDIITKSSGDIESKLDRAIQLGDTVRDAYVFVGYTFFDQGKPDKALTVSEKGISVFPDDFRINYLHGLVLQRLHRESEAVTYFEKAVSINPNEIGVLSTLALTYNGLGKYKESDDAYERALKIDPSNALVLNNYAYFLSIRGVKLDRALEMAKTAVNIEPESASYLDTFGWVYFKMGNYPMAKKYIEKAISINSGNAVLLEHLGDVYEGMKDSQNAVKYWKKSLELSPQNEKLKNKIEFYKI